MAEPLQLSFDDPPTPAAAPSEATLPDEIDLPDGSTPIEAPTVTPPAFTVEVIRSAKRKKTSQARLRGDVLEVRVPAWITPEQEAETVEHFVDKFQRSRTSEAIDLAERAEALGAEYDLPLPRSITWVSNQRDRWGSCTPAHGTIRLSDRMAGFPQWVIDYVIVHEMAHLLEASHNDRFWDIVARYPLTERARGYLLAKSEIG